MPPHGRAAAAPRELSPAVAGLLLLSLARGPLQSRGKILHVVSRAPVAVALAVALAVAVAFAVAVAVATCFDISTHASGGGVSLPLLPVLNFQNRRRPLSPSPLWSLLATARSVRACKAVSDLLFAFMYLYDNRTL